MIEIMSCEQNLKYRYNQWWQPNIQQSLPNNLPNMNTPSLQCSPPSPPDRGHQLHKVSCDRDPNPSVCLELFPEDQPLVEIVEDLDALSDATVPFRSPIPRPRGRAPKGKYWDNQLGEWMERAIKVVPKEKEAKSKNTISDIRDAWKEETPDFAKSIFYYIKGYAKMVWQKQI